METEILCRAIHQTLPLAELQCFEPACEKVQQIVQEYFALKTAYLRQPTAAQIRTDLRQGQALFRRLEEWMRAAEGTAVRDYVLSGKDQTLKQLGLTEDSSYKWRKETARFQLWQSWIAEGLLLLKSDRGQPENFPLKQLVRDLTKIWEQFTGLRFTNTSKGRRRPRDFILAVCMAIEPQLKELQIETAIRSAVSKTPGKRRGRKSHQSKRE
jgi:hypothetical protein